MKFLPFFILFCAASTGIRAQKAPHNLIFPYHHQVKFSLVPLHDPVNPGFEFTYEFQYARRWASQIGYTTLSNGIHELFDGEDEFFDFSGRRISFEQKYFYPAKHNHPVRKYFSLDLNHLDTRTTSVILYDIDRHPNDQTVLPDRMHIVRSTFSINLRYGFEIAIPRRWMLDISGGPGLKYRKVSNDFSPRYSSYIHNDWDLFTIDGVDRYTPIEAWVPNLTLNVKIGYMF